ncbi:class I SAM-dependent methyltransferase [Pseudoroseicyclus aestuarii]|uniref:SAM-dependent MidA family methyltransferase n=1 Tax=Pseudoroseicyclus aestuarii TaxID=1795041 RepID=A0A318SQW5_9RHOB|nr:SAM-dependent methyltransferase [Pseudoroseicyclus aestuarii]PYE84053.1 SAM-dependent MidA family methyltransferase [Pseudoroseicyclus aestuarii]
MTALGDLLAARISREGPITLADYMGQCLLHPQHGYYSTRDPLGAAGDFTTAPEISQMFGELIGLSLAQAWLQDGRPESIVLAELGPGRGTLMADALRATARVPGFHAALQLHLVEASPALRAEQASRLPQAQWHDRIETLPEVPLYLVANEFFDALPIRQFQRAGSGWRERMVTQAEGQLSFALAPPAPQPLLHHRLEDTEDGDLVELAPALPGIASEIGRRIAAHGGAALIFDYGGWRSRGDTLQALARHETADPLAAPGEADLTAHVDFEALARAADPARASEMCGQGVFLERLGITPRAQALAQGLTGAAHTAHVAAHRRLTHPGEMGDLFKVLGLYQQGATPPPGLGEGGQA